MVLFKFDTRTERQIVVWILFDLYSVRELRSILVEP